MEVQKANSGWLAFLVSGIVAIGYGVLAITLTDEFIDILEIVMRISGICIAATGGVFLAAAIVRMTKKMPWALVLLIAVALILVGVLSAVYSAKALALLIILMGIWSALIGAFMLMVTTRAQNLWNKGFYIASAILAIVFGVLVIAHPFGFAKWFIIMSGIIALVFGLIMVMFGFAVRRADKEVKEVKVEVLESKINTENP
jgi:uncharacterized membrane protein HdeD (DUF308 family)